MRPVACDRQNSPLQESYDVWVGHRLGSTPGKEAFGIVLISIALFAILVFMALTTDWLGGITAILGLTIGGLDIHLGPMTGLSRFYFLGALSIAAGTLTAPGRTNIHCLFPDGRSRRGVHSVQHHCRGSSNNGRDHSMEISP